MNINFIQGILLDEDMSPVKWGFMYYPIQQDGSSSALSFQDKLKTLFSFGDGNFSVERWTGVNQHLM